MKEKNDCYKFGDCSASICPLMENDGAELWYPTEAICPRKNSEAFELPSWVIKQRKIKKVIKDEHNDKYFTLDAIEKIKRITPKVAGLEVD